jgi:hypothetical protein
MIAPQMLSNWTSSAAGAQTAGGRVVLLVSNSPSTVTKLVGPPQGGDRRPRHTGSAGKQGPEVGGLAVQVGSGHTAG